MARVLPRCDFRVAQTTRFGCPNEAAPRCSSHRSGFVAFGSAGCRDPSPASVSSDRNKPRTAFRGDSAGGLEVEHQRFPFFLRRPPARLIATPNRTPPPPCGYNLGARSAVFIIPLPCSLDVKCLFTVVLCSDLDACWFNIIPNLTQLCGLIWSNSIGSLIPIGCHLILISGLIANVV